MATTKNEESQSHAALLDMRKRLQDTLDETATKIESLDRVIQLLMPGAGALETPTQRITPPATRSFTVEPVATFRVEKPAATPIAPVATDSRHSSRYYRRGPVLGFLNSYPLSVASFQATGGIRGNLNNPANRAFQVIACILMLADPKGAFYYDEVNNYGLTRGLWNGKTTLYGPLNRLSDSGVVASLGDGLWMVTDHNFLALKPDSVRPEIEQPAVKAARLQKKRENLNLRNGVHPRRIVDEQGQLVPTLRETILSFIPEIPPNKPINLRSVQERLFQVRNRRSSLFVIESTLRLMRDKKDVEGLTTRESEYGEYWVIEKPETPVVAELATPQPAAPTLGSAFAGIFSHLKKDTAGE